MSWKFFSIYCGLILAANWPWLFFVYDLREINEVKPFYEVKADINYAKKQMIVSGYDGY